MPPKTSPLVTASSRHVRVAALAVLTACSGPGPELIDVGGHRLEVLVMGDGSPAVVFEAGFIGGMERWRAIQDTLSRLTLTVAYERAGLGESEPGPEPRTAERIAAELDALLAKLGIAEPVILVGHSAGGLFARVFANAYPASVRALVLVDPITEDVYDHMRIVDSDRWTNYESEAATWPAPSGWYGQWRALPTSIEQARRSWPLPEVPIILFTATTALDGEWPVDTPEHMEVWSAANSALAEAIGGANHTVFPNSDHLSVLRRTEVAEAILALVTGAQQGARGAS